MIVVFIIVIISVIVYLFILRPEQIRKDCHHMVSTGVFQFSENQYLPMDLSYEECLNAYGVFQK